MERKYRVRLSSDFRRIRREGKSWAHRLVVLCVLDNDLEYSRFGFAVSKGVGNAVTRNRVRRRMREVVRLQRGSMEGGWDMVFIARPSIRRVTYAEIESAIEDLVARAGLRGALN